METPSNKNHAHMSFKDIEWLCIYIHYYIISSLNPIKSTVSTTRRESQGSILLLFESPDIIDCVVPGLPFHEEIKTLKTAENWRGSNWGQCFTSRRKTCPLGPILCSMYAIPVTWPHWMCPVQKKWHHVFALLLLRSFLLCSISTFFDEYSHNFVEHLLIALTCIFHDFHVLHGWCWNHLFPKNSHLFRKNHHSKMGCFKQLIMVVLFFETIIVMFHDVSKKTVFSMQVHANITFSIEKSHSIFRWSPKGGTEPRDLLGHGLQWHQQTRRRLIGTQLQIFDCGGAWKSADDIWRSEEIRMMTALDWGCNRHNRHKTGGGCLNKWFHVEFMMILCDSMLLNHRIS